MKGRKRRLELEASESREQGKPSHWRSLLSIIYWRPMRAKRELIVGKELPGYRAFLRSVLVSSLSFILDFFLCMFLVEKFQFGYLAATVMSFMTGTILNYCLSSRFVFGRGSIESRSLEFLAFIGIASIGLFLNAIDMYVLTSFLGLHYLVSRVIAGSLVFFFNYFCRKFLVFADIGMGFSRLIKRAQRYSQRYRRFRSSN